MQACASKLLRLCNAEKTRAWLFAGACRGDVQLLPVTDHAMSTPQCQSPAVEATPGTRQRSRWPFTTRAAFSHSVSTQPWSCKPGTQHLGISLAPLQHRVCSTSSLSTSQEEVNQYPMISVTVPNCIDITRHAPSCPLLVVVMELPGRTGYARSTEAAIGSFRSPHVAIAPDKCAQVLDS